MALSDSKKVGWIGLGNMGMAMAKNMQRHLAESGQDQLRVFNRTASRMDPVIDLGAKGCDSAVQVVEESDLIFVSTSDDTALQGIIEQVLKANNLSGKTVIDTTTVHPDTTKTVAAKLHARGATFVAAPCFGATPVAEQGKLLFAIAGPTKEADQIAKLVKNVLARDVIRVSEQAEKASLLKTSGLSDADDVFRPRVRNFGKTSGFDIGRTDYLRNFITAGIMELVAEALVFAEKTGLGVEVLQRLIEMNFGPVAYSVSQRMANGVYMPGKGELPWSDLNLAIKDVGHGISSAEGVGVKLEVGQVIMKHLHTAKDYSKQHGDRPLDSSAMYGVVREDAGLDFRTDFVKTRDLET